MKKLLLFLCFLFAVTGSNAALEVIPEATPEATLKSYLQKLNSYSASFTQTVYDEGEAIDKSTGKLYLQSPNKMRWQTMTPEESLFIADGDSIWNIDSFVEQVTVFPQQDAVNNNPFILLTDQGSDIWEKFKVEQLAPEMFAVTALEPSAQIVKLVLRFNQGELVSLTTEDGQTQRSEMVFSAIETNNALDASLFVANYPETYVVDDQR